MSTALFEKSARKRDQFEVELASGDHLSQREFHRLYSQSSIHKAELIDGIVHVASSVQADNHSYQHNKLAGWLMLYEAATPGVRASNNSTVILDDENEVQPDELLMIQSPMGQASMNNKGYLTSAPEFVAEVAASSAHIDLHSKLKLYERHGVKEYLVWNTGGQEIRWFIRKGSRFVKLAAQQGILRSRVFPGLWLNEPAMLAFDLATVIATLQEGLQSKEHATFVKMLGK
ncbi:MAG: Uma2 family endonuclease [Gemmatales bacterium]